MDGLNPDPSGHIHNSRTGPWLLWPPVARRIPEGSRIHGREAPSSEWKIPPVVIAPAIFQLNTIRLNKPQANRKPRRVSPGFFLSA